MEERLGEMRKGRREDEKGSHCFFKSSGYYKSELKRSAQASKFGFFKLIMH